jgi:hypothetical protein
MVTGANGRKNWCAAKIHANRLSERLCIIKTVYRNLNKKSNLRASKSDEKRGILTAFVVCPARKEEDIKKLLVLLHSWRKKQSTKRVKNDENS